MAGKRKRSSSGFSMRKRMRSGRRTLKTWRRRSRRNKSYTRTFSKQPFPDRMFTKLKFAEIYSQQFVADDIKTDVKLYTTSIYDPNAAVGGGQPMWRDTYAGIYTNYRVRGIKYHITGTCRTSPGGTWYMGVRHMNTTTDPDPNMSQWLERRDTRVKSGSGAGSGANRVTIKGYMSVAKTRGISKQELEANPNFEAAMGSNPALMAYLKLAAQVNNAPIIVDFAVRLTYYVEMFDLVTPPQS